MQRVAPLVLGIFCFVLVACGGSDEPAATVIPTLVLLPSTATATPTPTHTPTALPPTVNPLAILSPQSTLPLADDLAGNFDQLINGVLEDAAQRLEMPSESLQVLGAKAVIWAEDALDCDSPPADPLSDHLANDSQYGYRLIVGNQRIAAVYHTTGGGEFVYCDDANLLDQAGDPLAFDPLLGESIQQAREALAQRLGVPLASIQAVDVLAITWQDTSLGCPVEGENYLAQVTAGFRILLKQGENYYPYHADFVGVQFCPLERERLPAPFQATPTPTITPTLTATP